MNLRNLSKRRFIHREEFTRNQDKHLRYLEERIQYLEEVNRFTMDALEMAASLGDFQPNISKLEDVPVILKETRSRINRLIRLLAVTFFLVDEDTNDFYLADADPQNYGPYIKEEINFLIENGTFAWALREKRPVVVSSKNQNKQLILHIMATSSRTRGMFVGLVEKEKNNINDISLSLLSIILLNSSNALESFELYKMMREINKNLRKKENYKILFEAAPDAVEVLDRRGNIVDCNRAHQSLLGHDYEKIIGKHTTEFFSDQSKGLFNEKFSILKKNSYVESEVELVRSDGPLISVWRKEKAIYSENMEFVGSVIYNRDISMLKKAEQERKNLESQLQQAQKMEAIGTLAGGIAHDFNNILSAIIGYTEISKMKLPEDDDVQADLDEVFKAGGRAKNLVQQILTFSRQTEKEKKPVQMNLIIKEVLKLLKASLPSTIEIQQDIQSDSLVFGDPTQLHQVLMNLCTNAAHAMQEKGGVLRVELIDVEIDSEFTITHPDIKPGPYIKLTVSDTGNGMPPEVLDRIFDPFFTTKGEGQGTGMGLSVVHGIVKSYGGTIKAYSEPGKGSTFKVFSPVIERVVEPEAREEKPIPKGTEHILFVDDELSLVNINKQILESLGYKVTIRTSSIEALELFKTKPGRFDLVITDMTMPKMTGDVFAQKLMAVRQDIPVIICTGFSARIDEEKAKTMGIKAFVSKPILKRDIAVTIRKVLDNN